MAPPSAMMNPSSPSDIPCVQPAPPVESFGPGELVVVHTRPDDPANGAELARACVPAPAFYLLRPDGYIGLAGSHLDVGAVKQYLTALRL